MCCKGGSLDKLTEVVTDYSEIKDQMWTTYRDMQDLREQHPITAQTLLMLRELLGDKIENFDMDRVMYQGYRYCMAGLKDPAMALHHLTICMFQSLKVGLLSLHDHTYRAA